MAEENIIQSSGPTKNPLKKAFSKYFRARYQNLQNVYSNALYYAQMPPAWITYYNAFVRQWDEWTRGFVLSLHRGDMFSVGLGYTVCEIIKRECMKGRFRFDGRNAGTNKFMADWSKNTDFVNVVSNGFFTANRLGNAILRLNCVEGKNEAYASCHGVDKCYFEINRRQQVVRARFVDYLTSNTVDGKQYFVVEERIFIKDVPYQKVTLGRMTNVLNVNGFEPLTTEELFRLNPLIMSKFQDVYGEIVPNRWYKLPFKTLGCYNWKNGATSTLGMPGYSDSTVHTALDILYSLDYNWSMGQLDLYWGRSRALIPEELGERIIYNTSGASIAGTPTLHSGMTNGEMLAVLRERTPLGDEDFFTQYKNGNGLSDKPVQPVILQPDLRGQEHKYIRDADLELLATKVGLSAGTLAAHLSHGVGQKTATEVTQESTTTDTTVTDKRELAEFAINALIKDVLAYYGVVGECDITWNQGGQNATQSHKVLLEEYEAGAIPIDELVKRLHPELTTEEINVWCAKLQARQNMNASKGDLQ